ncbi:hypothetical protein [Leptospira alexanderi]|uniref:hypothetical protein n=1 Tax=Leptospira alexanderi TaxID=100053 RepID=UPI000990AAC7|nr:hypothetical protein [Leptospira alexanderi]
MGLIFITFNPNARVEESTALRVQTISNLYGIEIKLPYRLDSCENSKLTEETKRRIELSRVFVCYSSVNQSRAVTSEIEYALEKGKIVIRLFDENAEVKLLPAVNNVYSQKLNLAESNFTYTLNEISTFLKEGNKELQRYSKPLNSVLMIYVGMLVLRNLDSAEGI